MRLLCADFESGPVPRRQARSHWPLPVTTKEEIRISHTEASDPGTRGAKHAAEKKKSEKGQKRPRKPASVDGVAEAAKLSFCQSRRAEPA